MFGSGLALRGFELGPGPNIGGDFFVYHEINDKDKQRFWAKVNKQGKKAKHMDTRCWEWIANKGSKGYGLFWFQGSNRQAHRISWRIKYHGIIPDDKWVLHHCDNKSCVRPDHLYLGNHSDNMKDAYRRGQHGWVKYPHLKPQGNKHVPGELHPMSKLTADEVGAIRRLYEKKVYNQYQLANIFDISQTQIGRIVRREKWTHI